MRTGAVGELDQGQHLVDALPADGARDAVDEGVELEVLAPGELVVERWVLEHQADALPYSGRVEGHVDAGHSRSPGGRCQQRAEDRDRRRLSGAVRPQKTKDLAGTDFEVDPLDRLELAVSLHQARSLNDRVTHSIHTSDSARR